MSDTATMQAIAALIPAGARCAGPGLRRWRHARSSATRSVAAPATVWSWTMPTCWPACAGASNVLQLNLEDGLAMFERQQL